jgi:hypothetical protein
MIYYPDGAHRWQNVSHADLVTVGWLDGSHTFRPDRSRPPVLFKDFLRAERLVRHGLNILGEDVDRRSCALCFNDREDAPPSRRLVAGEYRILGMNPRFVPGKRRLYVFPSLMLHYIEQHDYLPPAPFLRAIRCTDPEDPAYHVRCIDLWQRISDQNACR